MNKLIIFFTLIIFIFCLSKIYNYETFLNQHKIYAGLVTIPDRSKNLCKVIDSIINQVDHLYVHLNYEKNTKIPKCLYNKKITITHAKNYGDLGDTGKFLGLCNNGFSKNNYSITIDDDILYPKNFVKNLINKSKQYNNKVILSYHGGILPKNVNSFKDERNLIHFNDTNNKKDIFVNICGTGCSLYPPNLLKLKMTDFKRKNTSDLFVAIEAQKQKIPIVVIRHKNNLFEDLNYQYSLWNNEKKNINNLDILNTNDAKKIEWKVIK